MDIYTEFPSLDLEFTERYRVIINALRKNNITTSELIISTPSNISLKIQRPLNEVKAFCDDLQQQLTKHFEQAEYDLPEDNLLRGFTTGDETIDSVFSSSNGIPLGYLVEFSGGSATGKSHFLMNLAITAQFPLEFNGLGSSIFESNNEYEHAQVMYIATEARLETQRLSQIIDHYDNLIFKPNGVPEEYRPCLKNVLLPNYVVTDLEYQDHLLMIQLPQVLKNNSNLKVVIIDSITHHIRAELTEYRERETYILKIVTFLKRLAMDYNISIIVANQVSDKPINEIVGRDMDYFMSLDYQMSWCNGWDSKGTIYRQTYDKYREEEEWDALNDNYYKNLNQDSLITADDDNLIGNEESTSCLNDSQALTPVPTKLSLSEQVKKEKRQMLFESKLRNSFKKVKTIPALGLNWVNLIDFRIFLSRNYKPILDEQLIEEFQQDLGIDTSVLEDLENGDEVNNNNNNGETTENENEELGTEIVSSPMVTKTTTKKGVSEILAANEYLANRNFETERNMRLVFSPFTALNQEDEVNVKFEIWNGGIRSC